MALRCFYSPEGSLHAAPGLVVREDRGEENVWPTMIDRQHIYRATR